MATRKTHHSPPKKGKKVRGETNWLELPSGEFLVIFEASLVAQMVKNLPIVQETWV